MSVSKGRRPECFFNKKLVIITRHPKLVISLYWPTNYSSLFVKLRSLLVGLILLGFSDIQTSILKFMVFYF